MYLLNIQTHFLIILYNKFHLTQINVFDNYTRYILNDILNSKATNDIQIKKVLDIMLKNNLESEAIKIVKENIRLNKPAFFSLELAMYYSVIMSIEKSIKLNIKPICQISSSRYKFCK